MIEGVDIPTSTEDKGADRDKRERLCARHPWCLLLPEHDGRCIRKAPREMPAADFGPKAATRKRR